MKGNSTKMNARMGLAVDFERRAVTLTKLLLRKAEESPRNVEIYEVILFGSTARESETPNDIDFMVIENGCCWEFIVATHAGNQEGDTYKTLGENLFLVMVGFFGITEHALYGILGLTKVDLHVLPLTFLTSRDVRDDVSSGHTDPQFFNNAFRGAKRFDREEGRFVPVALDDLERNYRCNLSDLR